MASSDIERQPSCVVVRRFVSSRNETQPLGVPYVGWDEACASVDSSTDRPNLSDSRRQSTTSRDWRGLALYFPMNGDNMRASITGAVRFLAGHRATRTATR